MKTLLRRSRWVRNRFFLKIEIMLASCFVLSFLIWFLYVLHWELMHTQLPMGLK